MYFDAERLIDFCAKTKMTVEQFLLCYLTHTEKFALLYKYCDTVRPFPASLIKDLEKKKFLMNLNKEGEGFPDNLVIDDKFTTLLVGLLGEEAQELFDAFPSEIGVAGKAFNGKTISPEDLELSYYKKLLRAKSTHAEVMDALNEQIDNGTVGMGLKKWFETEQWRREDNTIDITCNV
jgi:hypothetical protein